MKLESSRQIFEEYLNIKFHENSSSGSRVVPCGRTDMTKLTVAFRDFANAANISPQYEMLIQIIRCFYSCYIHTGGRTNGQDISNWYKFATFTCERVNACCNEGTVPWA